MNLKLFIFPMSLVLTFFGFIYFIQPEWANYSRSKDLLATAEQKYEKINKNKSSFDEILFSFEDLEFEEKELIEKSIPTELSEEIFLNSLSLILADSGAVLKDVAFKEVKASSGELKEGENDGVDAAGVSLKLAGNYFQFKKVLYLLESLDRLTLVDSFNLDKSSESNSALNLGLNLTIFNKNKKSSLNIRGGDSYLMTLLEEDLDVDFVLAYKEYRELISDFNLDKSGLGRDNLFSEDVLVDVEDEDLEVDEADEADSVDQELTTETDDEALLVSDEENL